MLKKLSFIVAFVCCVSGVHASVTVNANAVGVNVLLNSSGVALPTGDIVRIGYFNASLSTLQNSNSFSLLNSDFKALGEGNADGDTLTENNNATDTMDINGVAGAGSFAGSFGNVSSSYLSTGSLLYMWVFNSATPSTASQWGIYYFPTSSQWQFPSDPGVITMSLSSSVTVVRGSSTGSGFELANIPAVPEPTTISLLASAVVMGGVALRRRK
jgi:hypothetical protein